MRGAVRQSDIHSAAHEAKADTRRVVRRLWRYLSAYGGTLLLAAALMLLSNLLSLAVPWLSGRAVDYIGMRAGGVDFAGVLRCCLLMLLCYLAASAFSYLQTVSLLRVSQEVSMQLRADIFNRFVELPVAFCDTHPVGDIISVVCYDVDTVNASLSTDLVQVCTSVFTVAGSLVMLVALAPALSPVVLLTVPFTILFSRYQMKRLHKLFRARSRKLGALNGMAEECVTGQRTFAAYGREAEVLRRFDAQNDDAMQAYYIADYKSCILGPGVNFVNNISLAAGSVLGALLCMSGGMTLGAVSSFVLYSRKFSGPIREAANIASEIQAAAAAAERVLRLIDEPPEQPDAPDATPLRDVRGDVALHDVRFRYEGGAEVLHGLSLDVKRGSVVAIVGPTGAGKTTIVNLLMRFYDPCGGRITVDGVEVREAVRRDLRLSYAMVLQDTWLFHGTIYENLAYGNASATREQVVEAAKAARIHSFIEALPEGYDTLLTDDSVNLSKGQKQLMTIARAMLIDAHMLILDEATSNVDTATELAINDAMRRLMHGKTCFVIAHRLSTIRNADTILVLEGGRVVEQGTHEALLAAGGAYRSLYEAQFETV